MNKRLHTKFGIATLKSNGYYQINSNKEGNHNKHLHRLIFEDFYGEIPEGFQIHHKNGNPVDNCILNLQLLSPKDHYRLHKKGKLLSNETKKKMSENNARYWLGKESPLKKSYARVVKKGFKKNKQNYVIKEDGKFVKQSVNPSNLVDWFTSNYPNKILVLGR